MTNSNKVKDRAGNTKGGYHCTVGLLVDLFGSACFANKNKNCYHTVDSKVVKQEVNRTVILPPLVFSGPGIETTAREPLLKGKAHYG
jgi:hypothetical protein